MKKLVKTMLVSIMAIVTAASIAMAGEDTQLSVTTSRVDNDLSEIQVLSADENVPEEQVTEEVGATNPLTGEGGYSDEEVSNRPVAVMINNHPNSYPQYNIGQADVLFEVVVEHDLTRFLAIFADYANVPYLVSVRSYRYYFPAISIGFDAFYIHWGEDTTMTD